MNRLSWDTTAPRRPGARRAPQPRPGVGADAAPVEKFRRAPEPA